MDLPDLLCSLCHNFLSIFPVYAYEDGGAFKFICGRCPLKKDVVLQRQIAYESLAQDMTFPCQNKCCDRRLIPEMLEQHEYVCTENHYCPAIPKSDCSWRGGFSLLYKHYKDKHSGLLFEKELHCEVDIAWSFKETYVVKTGIGLFLIYLQYSVETNQFSCYLRYSSNSASASMESYLFKLTVTSDFVDYALEGIGTVLTINDKQNLNVESVEMRNCQSKQVTCRVTITKLLENGPEINPSFMQIEMPECLECPVCLESMRPPIMQCETGHRFCESCKNKISKCSICNAGFGNARNFALETFTGSIIYSCTYRIYGCSVALKLKDTISHESRCVFKPISCVGINCKWKNISSTYIDHVKSYHRHQLLCGHVCPYKVGWPINWISKMIVFDNKWFLIRWKYKNPILSCSGELLDPNHDGGMYVFEVNFFGDREAVTIQTTCNSYQEDRDISESNCVHLHEDSFKNILKGGVFLRAYVRIAKKRNFNL